MSIVCKTNTGHEKFWELFEKKKNELRTRRTFFINISDINTES